MGSQNTHIHKVRLALETVSRYIRVVDGVEHGVEHGVSFDSFFSQSALHFEERLDVSRDVTIHALARLETRESRRLRVAKEALLRYSKDTQRYFTRLSRDTS